MSRPSAPLPAALGEAFSVRAATQAGLTAGRLRDPGLGRPFRGVRARSTEPPTSPAADSEDVAREALELRARIMRHAQAFALIAAPDWFFSHITAAVIWSLPLPIRLLRAVFDPADPRGLDVAVWAPRRAPRAAGVRGHELRSRLAYVRTHRGLRVASPATTWALLAPLLDVDELIEVGDALVRIPRRRGMERGTSADALATIDQLTDAIRAGRRVGTRKLRDALPHIRVGSASTGETRVRLALLRAGLPEPSLDIDVFAQDGTPIGYTELAYPDHRLLIEYEGDHHRRDRAQWDRDIEKHAECVAAGWNVIRLTARHVHPSPAPAVHRIREALIRAGWRP